MTTSTPERRGALILPFRGGGPPKVVEGQVKVKARSAVVCPANGKLEAGARQRITRPGRRGGPKRSEG